MNRLPGCSLRNRQRLLPSIVLEYDEPIQYQYRVSLHIVMCGETVLVTSQTHSVISLCISNMDLYLGSRVKRVGADCVLDVGNHFSAAGNYQDCPT